MAEYQLTVGGQRVSLTGEGQPDVVLESFAASYSGPRELTFRERDPHGVPSFGLNVPVALSVDGAEVFNGRIVELSGGRMYAAKDTRYAAAAINLLNPETGRGSIGLPAMPANEVIGLLLAMHAEAMALEGVPATMVNAPTGLVSEHSYSGTLMESVSHVLGQLPGWAVLVEPEAWHFIDTRVSPELTIDLDATRTGGFEALRFSLEDRYTAVRLVGSDRTCVERVHCTMSAGWDSSREAAWTIADAHASDPVQADGESPSAYAGRLSEVQAQRAVFRRWTIPTGIASSIIRSGSYKESSGGEVQVIDMAPQVHVRRSVEVEGEETRWTRMPVADLSNLAQGVVWTAQPLIKRAPKGQANEANLHQPGKCKAAETPMLVYYRQGIFNNPGLRRPAEGFEGTAYTLAGVQRERVVELDDAALLTGEYAQQVLDQLKDIVMRGSVEVIGDAPAATWGLDARINLTTSKRATGYEHVAAPLQAMSYDFAARRASLDLSTPVGGTV